METLYILSLKTVKSKAIYQIKHNINGLEPMLTNVPQSKHQV